MVSKVVLAALCLVAFMAVASARPRFLAIPLEDVEFFRGPSYPILRRSVRQAPRDGEPEAAADSSYGRGSSYSGGNDYVDYGAYTGGYGAFGWYTDHPVGNAYKN